MKVVKCLDHIPKELWGMVIECDLDYDCICYDDKEYNLNPNDTFPLPEQGDEVEVSRDGESWKRRKFQSYASKIKLKFTGKIGAFYCYYELPDESGYAICGYEYLRPIEKKEKPKHTLSIRISKEYEPIGSVFINDNEYVLKTDKS